MLLAHDHSKLDAALAAVFSALAAGDVERSFRNLDLFWAYLAVHIRAENICLFPTLLQASEQSQQTDSVPARETVREIIARLRADHDFFMSELARAMKQLRELHRSDRQDSAPILAKVQEQMSHVHDRLEAHNALEESRVYQWAGALLDESEQKALNEKLALELNNVPARFQGP
jgi:hemerythrin-like domain-containing protein